MLPPQNPTHTCRLRIFTPKEELPFAGHPTVGTAAVLSIRQGIASGEKRELILEEGVGPVRVSVRDDNDVLFATFIVESEVEEPSQRPTPDEIAKVLSLAPDDVLGCWFASVGLPFCFVHLADASTVDRAIIDMPAWKSTLANARSSKVYFFSGKLEEGAQLYARMFAPASVISEDPATGSAAATLVGSIANRVAGQRESFAISIHQGAAMGRRSEIRAQARLSNGSVSAVSVTGSTVQVARGELEVAPQYLA